MVRTANIVLVCEWLLTSDKPGLGQYLLDVDPEHRPVKWQIQHIMILCRVHFLRGIENVIGPKKRQSPDDYFQNNGGLIELPISMAVLSGNTTSSG